MKIINASELQGNEVLERLARIASDDTVELVGTNSTTALLERLLQESPLRYEFWTVNSGPDGWRVQVSAHDGQEPRSVTAYLGRDHDRLDDLLRRAVQLAGRDDWDTAKSLISDFRVGLFWHIQVEERFLFPAFEEQCGYVTDGPTDVMRGEHAAIKESVDGLVDAVAAQDPDELARHHADILGVLVEHNMKEESVLYPETDRALSESARNVLVERIMLAGGS